MPFNPPPAPAGYDRFNADNSTAFPRYTANDFQAFLNEATQSFGYEADWMARAPGPVTSLVAAVSGSTVSLSWQNDAKPQTALFVIRNGVQVASLPGSMQSFTDNPGAGAHVYSVQPGNQVGGTGYPCTPDRTHPTVNAVVAGDPPTPSAGWTDLTLPAAALAFYVSASGSDSNTGTQAAPFRTIGRGFSALRDGQPDQCLLKCGDTFDLSNFQSITKGCNVAGKYMVLGQYGTGARPKIRGVTCFRGESINKRGIAFVGLDIEGTAPGVDNNGILLLGWSDVLVEDCKIHKFGYPLVVQGFDIRSQNIKVRRNVILDAFYGDQTGGAATGRRAVGFYVDLVDHLLIEGNFFDRCGNKGEVQGRPVYIQDNCTDVTYENNVTTRSCAEGVQVRPGGKVRNNLAIRCPIGIYVGFEPGAVPGNVNDVSFNCVVESGDCNTTDRRGREIYVNGPADIHHNVAYANTGSGWGYCAGIAADGSGRIADNWVDDWTRNPALGGPGDIGQAWGIMLEGGGAYTLDRNRVFQRRPGIVLERLGGAGSESGTGNLYAHVTGQYPAFPPGSNKGGWTAASPVPADPNVRAAIPGGIDAYIQSIRTISRQNWHPEWMAATVNDAIRAPVGVANP